MLVKYYDLEHNLDSTRLPAHLKATQNYLDRTEKYRQFQEEIINTLSNSLCGTAESGERLV